MEARITSFSYKGSKRSIIQVVRLQRIYMSSLKSLWKRDKKEIAYDPDEDLDKDTLMYTLQQLKVPQLQKNAIFC